MSETSNAPTSTPLAGTTLLDAAGMDDTRIGQAYKLMLQAHQDGLHVDFLTGTISLPEQVSTHVSSLKRFATDSDDKLQQIPEDLYGLSDVEYAQLDDVQPLIDAAYKRGGLAARELSARLCDHYGHNWSGAPALVFFECAEQIRNETNKFAKSRGEPAMQVSSSMYYMRDNHTVKRLSPDVDAAIAEITAELDAGYTSGMLASNCRGAPERIHARHNDREVFLKSARKWLEKAVGQPLDGRSAGAGA